MEKQELISRLKKIDILPTFASVVGEIISLIDDPMSSASDLARRMDPSIAGEVLRIANSAYYGMKSFRKISTLEHAIAVMGFQSLSRLVLQMPFLFMTGRQDSVFDRDAFVAHSTLTALFAKLISTETQKGNPGEVYISGMVHDIGIIIMYRHFKDEWGMINRLIIEKKMSRVSAEQEVFSFDHGLIGGILLELWNVPKSVTDGVAYHHSPDSAQENRENVIITYMANRFAKRFDTCGSACDIEQSIADNQDILDEMATLGKRYSPVGVETFFEKIAGALRETARYTQSMQEERG